MRTWGAAIVGCSLASLASAVPAAAQIVAGLDVVRGSEPSEFHWYAGLATERHLVAYSQSRLRDEALGKGCSSGVVYEFTPRGMFSVPPDPPADPAGRLRRFQLFASAEVAAVNDSCGDLTVAVPVLPEPEEPETRFGRYHNARASVSGGVRVLLHDSRGPINLVARVAFGSRRFFGNGNFPGRTAAGISAGIGFLWFPLREP